MIEREQLHDLKRRAVAVSELVSSLNVDIAKFSLAQGERIDHDKPWFRWFCRAFAKSGTMKTCMSDFNLYIKKAVEHYDDKLDESANC